MTQPSLNRRLTTIDSTFLYLEKAEQPMHIGGCMLYEGRVPREELARLLLDRLHRLPRYRQKVVFPPFTLAHPTWEDDPDFDIDHHIDEVMLPAPADDRTMAEVGGRVYGGMLDRRHPLWKLILLQGRSDGHTAIVWKIHHAMIDGMSGVDLTMVLHDLTPDAEPPTPPATPWQPRPLPDPITLLQDAVRDRLTEAAQSFRSEGRDRHLRAARLPRRGAPVRFRDRPRRAHARSHDHGLRRRRVDRAPGLSPAATSCRSDYPDAPARAGAPSPARRSAMIRYTFGFHASPTWVPDTSMSACASSLMHDRQSTMPSVLV